MRYPFPKKINQYLFTINQQPILRMIFHLKYKSIAEAFESSVCIEKGTASIELRLDFLL